MVLGINVKLMFHFKKPWKTCLFLGLDDKSSETSSDDDNDKSLKGTFFLWFVGNSTRTANIVLRKSFSNVLNQSELFVFGDFINFGTMAAENKSVYQTVLKNPQNVVFFVGNLHAPVNSIFKNCHVNIFLTVIFCEYCLIVAEEFKLVKWKYS